MKKYLRVMLALGVLAALLLSVAGCGGGGNGGASNNWDEMNWDQGTWQ